MPRLSARAGRGAASKVENVVFKKPPTHNQNKEVTKFLQEGPYEQDILRVYKKAVTTSHCRIEPEGTRGGQGLTKSHEVQGKALERCI